MSVVLVVTATSSDAVEALECTGWLVLPAEEAEIRRVLTSMLAADGGLRRYHFDLQRQGFVGPPGPAGCTTWIVDVPARRVSTKRDIKRVAEDLLFEGTEQASIVLSYDAATTPTLLDGFIREAARVSRAAVAPGERSAIPAAEFQSVQRRSGLGRSQTRRDPSSTHPRSAFSAQA